MKKLTESKAYADRKGAAFGIAGIVNGLGIPCLKKNGVMERLGEFVKDTQNARAREGALLAVCLFLVRRLFRAVLSYSTGRSKSGAPCKSYLLVVQIRLV